MALSRCKSSLGSSQNCEQIPGVAQVRSITRFSLIAHFLKAHFALAKMLGQWDSKMQKGVVNAIFGSPDNQE
jgi:hypothetical protein